MTTALLALSVLVASQDLKKPVTYDCVASSVEKILADLSPQAGLRLRGSATTNPMLIMLHVEKAPLETVLKKLAEVTEAEWVREEGGMALSRTPAVQNRLDQESFQRKLKNIEKALAKLQETNAKAPVFEGQTAENLAMRLSEVSKRQSATPGEFDQGAYQTIDKLQKEMPVGRSANRLAAMFDAKTLANLPKEGRTVFSTAPNKSQRPFPAGLQAEMNRLMQEQAVLVDALKRHPLPKQNDGYYMDRRSTQAMEMPSRVLAKVATFGGKSVSFEFIFVNSKNKSMTRTSTYMSPDGESRGDGDMEKIKAAGGGEKVEIEGDLKALCDALKPLFGGARDGKQEVQLPQELLQKVLNPEKYEPITYTAGPLMASYAKAKRQNVIVPLNDTLVAYSTYISFFGEPTTERLEAAFKTIFNIQEEGGWVTITTGGGSDGMEMKPIARDVLGLLVRAEYSGTKLNLWQKIQIAPRVPGQVYETLLGFWQALATGKQDYNDSSDWETLRFLGSLSADQFQGLRAGREIPFAQLNEAQLSHIRKMVFNGYGGFEREYESTEAPAQSATADGEEGQETMYWDDLGDEPTELFPNGLPSDAKISMTVEDKDVLFGERSKKQNEPRYSYEENNPIEASSLAWQTISKERPDLFPWAADQPTFDQFVRGKFTSIDVKFKFRPKLAMSRQVRDKVIDKNAKRLTFADLPEDFKKQYEEQLKSYRESYKNMKPGDFGGGGRVIPPAR